MRFHGYFYPRPPRGGRRSAPLFRPSSRNYFYPRPPRGGRRQARSGRQVAQDISIHALREEGDYTVQIVHVGAVISIHALREEGDGSFSQFILDLDTFLSTPSARRATSFAYAGKLLFPISIHALREEGDSLIPPRTLPRWNFYPRPPRGGRQKVYDLTGYSVEFLSTPSARRATAPKTSSLVGALSFLSTPSARRATSIAFIKLDMACYFYPRPPRGGRPAPQL